jgi:hypothetical protein
MGFSIKQYYGIYDILTNNMGHIKLKHIIGILYDTVQYNNNMVYLFLIGKENDRIKEIFPHWKNKRFK